MRRVNISSNALRNLRRWVLLFNTPTPVRVRRCTAGTIYTYFNYCDVRRTCGSTKSWRRFVDECLARVEKLTLPWDFILENNFVHSSVLIGLARVCNCEVRHLQLRIAAIAVPFTAKIAEIKSKTIMSSQAFRIIVLLLAACAMTTCLSLYLTTSSRKFGLEFAARGNPQLRLRHTFDAVKKSQLDAPKLDFRLVIHGSF